MNDYWKERTHLYRFSSDWLSEGIGESYKKWSAITHYTSASRVFIQSPTGTGKTTFIIDTLCPYAASMGRNILYFGNRVALKKQTELAMERHFKERNIPQWLAEIGEIKMFYLPDKTETTGAVITFLNYQEFLKIEKTDLLDTPYYVILDEAHFFLEDALFNTMTAFILEHLIMDFTDSALIFMSATMEESAESILTVLEMYQHHYWEAVPLVPPHLFVYQNSVKKGEYRTKFFEKKDDIVAEICKTPREEKWLIFETSKQKVDWLKHEIERRDGGSVGVLTAEKKNSGLWKELVEKSHYEKRILISTKVMDNGVNVHDPTVKHIVIPFCSRAEFLQMLGRKRMQEGDVVRLYVALPKIQTINTQLHQVNEMIEATRKVKDYTDEKRKTALLQEYWGSGKQYINALFYIDENRFLCPNRIAIEKLQQLRDFYRDLRNHSNDPDYYPKLVFEWMQNTSEQKVHRLGIQNDAGLISFLQSNLERPISDSQQDRFYQEFLYLYKQQCNVTFKGDQVKLTESLSIRKGKTQRKATINKSLAMLNLPYEVRKEKNCWVVHKKLT